MPLTNAQHDAIMRIYDGIRTHNRHIQEQRYNEIVSLIPEYQNIENEIISVSMQAAKARISGNSQDYTSLLKSLNRQICLLVPVSLRTTWILYTHVRSATIPDI